MATKIGITGVHGSGKSNLTTKLKDRYRQSGKTVYVVREVARKCPYTLGSVCAQEYIWRNQIEKEKYAMRREVDVIICDRTVMDNLIYYYAVLEDIIGNHDNSNSWEQWDRLYKEACDWMPTYSHVIRLPLNLEWLQADDPIRPKDVEYARRIDKLFDRYVEPFVTNHSWE